MDCQSELWLAKRELLKLELETKSPLTVHTVGKKNEDESDSDLWLARRELRRLEKKAEESAEQRRLDQKNRELVDQLVRDFTSFVGALRVLEEREYDSLLEEARIILSAQERMEQQRRRNIARQRALEEDIHHEKLMLDIENERRMVESVRMKEMRKRADLKNRVEEEIQRAEMHLVTEKERNRRQEGLEAAFFKDFQRWGMEEIQNDKTK